MPVSTRYFSPVSYLEISSNSTDEGEVPHSAYLVLRIVSQFSTKIAVLCHHAKINDLFSHGGRAGPSSFSKRNKVEILFLKTLILHIELRLPTNMFS